MNRRDLIDLAGVVLLGVVVIFLLYCGTVAMSEHLAAESALPK